MIAWIQENSSGIIISIISSTVGALITWFFAVKYRSSKKITCLTESEDVITIKNHDIDGLKIYYRNDSINTLTKTDIVLWNSGNTVINRDDLAEKDPLRIKIESNDKIYDYGINRVSKKACDFSLMPSEDKHSLALTFDFMGPKDGINIYILRNSLKRINLFGTIKGTQGGIRPKFSDKVIKKSIEKKFTNFILFVFIVVLTGLFGLIFTIVLFEKSDVLSKIFWGFLFFSFLFCCIAYKSMSKNVPKNLRKLAPNHKIGISVLAQKIFGGNTRSNEENNRMKP